MFACANIEETGLVERVRHPGGNITGVRYPGRGTGIGIPEDKRDAIFVTLSQADSSTAREYGGKGLGLSITRAFVEKMGGRIWVESQKGKGSEFILPCGLSKHTP